MWLAVFELIPLPPSLGKRRGFSDLDLNSKLSVFIQEAPPLFLREGGRGGVLEH
jgi:hypothetical protein